VYLNSANRRISFYQEVSHFRNKELQSTVSMSFANFPQRTQREADGGGEPLGLLNERVAQREG